MFNTSPRSDLSNSLKKLNLSNVPTCSHNTSLQCKNKGIDYTKVKPGPIQPLVVPQWPQTVSKGPIGGRLSQYYQNWAVITDDDWTLRTIKYGLTWDWVHQCPPPLSRHSIECGQVRPELLPLYREAIHNDLQDGFIEVVPDTVSLGFYSRYWLKVKPDTDSEGKLKYRRLLDLSFLNKYIDNDTFTMETAETIRSVIEIGEYTTSIDYQDAYFHILINKRFRKYLRFAFEGVTYQLRVLPQGANISPRVFTAIIAPIKQFCHLREIKLYQYLDDWLVRHKIPCILKEHTGFVINIAEHCGFVRSVSKCDLVPKQVFKFLGYMFDTIRGLVTPPENRWVKLDPAIKSFMKSAFQTGHEWQKLIGILVALSKLVPLGMCRLRPIQTHFQFFWNPAYSPPSQLVPVSQTVKHHLRWWKDRRNLLQGVPFRKPKPEVHVYTDASDFGWGAHVENQSAQGYWSADNVHLHINCKELLAVYLALVQFTPLLQGRSVLIMTDNTSVVGYINKEGGTVSQNLCNIAMRIYQWASYHSVVISARHIAGILNIWADRLSRFKGLAALEWAINQTILTHIWQLWGTPQLDLFATWLNNRLPVYVSQIPDPQAIAVDAFSILWNDLFIYAFPPYRLLNKTLFKFRQEGSTMILIAPLSTEQSWYPELLDLLARDPLSLPDIPNLLSQQGQICGNVHKLHAWFLSTERKVLREYRTSLTKIVYGVFDSQIGFLQGYPIPVYPLQV